MSIVCKCTHSTCGAGSPSCSTQQELQKVVVIYFFCVGNAGFTRAFQDYSSGPGTQDCGQVESSVLFGLAG